MNYKDLKQTVALEAISYISSGIIGIGTGTTVYSFIKELSKIKNNIYGAVSSSKVSTMHLKKHGIRVIDVNTIKSLPIYVDSADEINGQMEMIKGGGGALTGEKIIAEMADTFICIVDETKYVEVLGTFPLPVEVIPMAKSYIMRELIKLGGIPQCRKNVVTDYGNIIIDIHNFKIVNPIAMEKKISLLPGVVTVGIFARRRADITLISTVNGIRVITNV